MDLISGEPSKQKNATKSGKCPKGGGERGSTENSNFFKFLKFFKLMDLEGGSQNSTSSLLKLGQIGGGHQMSNFPNIEKSPNHWGKGGGRSRKIWTFSTVCDFFV